VKEMKNKTRIAFPRHDLRFTNKKQLNLSKTGIYTVKEKSKPHFNAMTCDLQLKERIYTGERE
jgi:hypothetical protein